LHNGQISRIYQVRPELNHIERPPNLYQSGFSASLPHTKRHLFRAAETREHHAAVFAATDFPHWTHYQAGFMEQLAEAYKPIAARPNLLLAGNASGEFKREVEEMGWEISLNVRNEYLPTIPWATRDEELLDRD
jgi:hypothetical protein